MGPMINILDIYRSFQLHSFQQEYCWQYQYDNIIYFWIHNSWIECTHYFLGEVCDDIKTILSVMIWLDILNIFWYISLIQSHFQLHCFLWLSFWNSLILLTKCLFLLLLYHQLNVDIQDNSRRIDDDWVNKKSCCEYCNQ